MTDIEATINALHLEPGDIIALRSHRRLTMEQAANISDTIQDIVGDNHPVMILPPELELMVVRYPLAPSDDPVYHATTTNEGTSAQD